MSRFLTTSAVLVLFLFASGTRALWAQGDRPASGNSSSSSASASKQEVDELRSEVAAQQQTIEELRTMVQQLVKQQGSSDAHVVNASIIQSQPGGGEEPLAVAQKSEKSGPSKTDSGRLEWTVGGTTVQLYGHADVSYDYVDNGISPVQEGLHLSSLGLNPAQANNGWLGQISSNLSYFGVRGSHKVNSYLTGIFQVETEVMYSDTPGPTSDLQCKYCLGSRDTYVGVKGPWGAVKMGKEDAPYKRTTTGAFDPFLNSIGDARSIMGNSGGDNRAEFMGRVSHAIWYESPTYKGFYTSILFAPGQNRSSDTSAYPRGEPNCGGGNGAFTLSFANSGNVPEGADLYSVVPPDLNPCNDGSFNNVLSAAVTYRGYGLYAFGAYEHHGRVNRTGDLVGVADEAAWKFGTEYTIKKTGTTPSFVYEGLKRYGATAISAAIGQPVVDPRLNERSRPLATWVAVRQKLTKKDTLNFSWIHAGKTPGDPGFCAPEAPGNCAEGQDPATAPADIVNNSSNMYAAGIKHTISKNMTTYFVYARQVNHPDAHYDLGAVGHGLVVDKKDFTGHGFTGLRLQGVSGGMTFNF
jgi:predicted porin